MAFLVVGRERHALQIGETRLGGDRAGAGIPVRLRSHHATLSLMTDGVATLWREGDSAVSVNGKRLGSERRVLAHGDRIQAGHILMVFGHNATDRREATPERGAAHGDARAAQSGYPSGTGLSDRDTSSS